MTRDRLTHLDPSGKARMVDVSAKKSTLREAEASARVVLGERAFNMLMEGGLPKGDAMAAARIAGIMAAKKVDELIPLCHPLPLQSVELDFRADDQAKAVEIRARTKINNVTGVEMEAMTAVSVAALTIYDMCKSVEKGIFIEKIRLEFKTGGKSGTWTR